MQAQGIAALAPGQAAPMQNPMTQQQTPMGPNPGIPPDLKQLLSQQARNEMAQAAQRYQALQQALQMGQGTGKPPTIAQQVAMQGQKERAAIAGPAMQVQDQQKKAGLQALADAQRGQPENPPQPESQGIAELDVPEMGMAGGGIIAFSGEDNSYVEGDTQALSDLKKWWQEHMPESIPGITGFSKEAKIAEFMRSEAERQAAEEQAAQEGAAARMHQRQPGSLYNYLFTPVGNAGRGQINPPPISEDAQAANAQAAARIARQEGTPTMPGIATEGGAPPAPTAGPRMAPQQASAARMPVAQPPEASPVDDFTKQAQDLALASAKQDPMAQARTMAAEYAKTQGISDLVKQQQDMLEEQRTRYAQANANRLPAWAMGAMGATQPRGGGLGSLLASWGGGAAKAQEGYTKEDLAQGEKLDALRGAIIKAQMDGNQKKADALLGTYEKEVQAKASGLGSTASLAGTLESAKLRLQAAKDAAASRIAQANEGRLNRASEQDSRTYNTLSNQALARATAVVEAADKADKDMGKTNPISPDERIMEMWSKFMRASLPPTLQRMAPDQYVPKDSRVSAAPPAGKVLNAKT